MYIRFTYKSYTTHQPKDQGGAGALTEVELSRALPFPLVTPLTKSVKAVL